MGHGSVRSAILRPLLLGLSLLLVTALGACSNNEQSDGQSGYVGSQGSLTRVPPAERQPVPVFSGAGLDGTTTVSSADYPNKVVVLNVWGSWCPPCRKEAPDLQAASVETASTAQFIGVTTKDYNPAPAQAFVRANKITYPSIYDPDGEVLLVFARDLPPSAIPSTLIIDREGRLAVRILGVISKVTLVQLIDDVAAGR